MSIRGNTAIVGFHELPTLRDYGDRSVISLIAEAARGAVRDAGLRKEDIDGVINAEGMNSLTLSQHLGLKPHYTASMTTHDPRCPRPPAAGICGTHRRGHV